MAEVIVHADAALTIQLGLTGAMASVFRDDVPVLGKIPTKRPPEFLLVLAAGGTRRDLVVDVPTIIVEAWAGRPSRAIELAQRARALMHWFTEIANASVYNVSEFAAPGDLPDPLTNHARYTATYSVPMRNARVARIG